MNAEMISAGGVAKLFGMGLRKAQRWAARPGFPTPVRTQPHRLWDRDAVLRWAIDEGYFDPVTETVTNLRLCPKCSNCGISFVP